MKAKKYFVLILGIFILFSCKKKEIEGPEIREGKIEMVTISATDPVVGEHPAYVYLPHNYDPQREPGYPVIYLLHGFGGDPLYWVELHKIKYILDYLISTGELIPCIVVMPMGKNDFGGSWYTNSIDDNNNPVFGNWEDYIINDVINYIDQNYNTDPSKRAITGLSMGGYGAIKLAGLYPEKFVSAASHSGVLVFDVFLGDANQNGIADLVEAVLAENGGSMDRQDFANIGPDKVYTAFMVSMSAAFSPKVGPLSAFDTTQNEWNLKEVQPGIWVGIKLPFLNTGQIIDTVWKLWKNHDPVVVYQQNASNIIAKGLKVFLDCGDKDEFSLNYHLENFKTLLDNMGLEYDAEIFSSEEESIIFPPVGARHTNYIYSRLKKSFIFHSEIFQK